jgi:hypothetical protein
MKGAFVDSIGVVVALLTFSEPKQGLEKKQ